MPSAKWKQTVLNVTLFTNGRKQDQAHELSLCLIYQLSVHPSSHNVGAVRVQHDLLKHIFQSVERRPMTHVGTRRINVDQYRVEHVAGLELTDRQAERLAATGSRQPERVGNADGRIRNTPFGNGQ